MKNSSKRQPITLLWDLFCTFSLVGIWPRFIEPQLIYTTRLNLPIKSLPSELEGLKILQISDLHFNKAISKAFLDKLIVKINALNPDIITLTGDFICQSAIDQPKKLAAFLKRFKAPYGCYAVLGNHDYAESITINADGDYDRSMKEISVHKKAFKRFWDSIVLTKKHTQRVKTVPCHPQLVEILNNSPFTLLHNETKTIPIKNSKLNISGLGEYIADRVDPVKTFSTYDITAPGIILLHNPDGAPHLNNYPGDVILCGHTHGGQINLPWLWKKFTLMENQQFKKGLHKLGKKWLYVNRGLGSVLKFRWFSPPEILLLTLEKSS